MTACQFVIAGRVDCQQYARLEAAAEYLNARLPSCRVFKEPQPVDRWPCYLRRTCLAQGWDLPADLNAPLVWRLLVQRGGRGLLIGGLSEFLQLVAVYYGLPAPQLDKVAAVAMAAETARQEQLATRLPRQERAAFERRLTSVAVIGALSQAAYHFLTALATGRVLGEQVVLRLQLLGDPRQPELMALRHELQDLASPQLGQVAVLPTLHEAVRNAIVVIVLDPIANRPPPPPPEPEPEPEPSPPPPPPSSPPPAPSVPSAKQLTPVSTDDMATAEEANVSQDSPGGAMPPPPEIDITEAAPPPAQLEMPSSPPTSARYPSAEARRLSTIQEDPDSEAKEEELASRPDTAMAADSSAAPPSTPQAVTDPPVPADDQQTSSAASDVEDKPVAELARSASGTSTVDSTAAPAPPASPDTEPADGKGGQLTPSSSASDQSCDVTQEEVESLFRRMREYAAAIDASASGRCRVVVAGGRLPCFAATVVLLHAPRLQPGNVIALCQPRVNQLRALLAAELGVCARDIHDLAEWGNPPAGRSWVDTDGASVSRHCGAVRGPPGYRRPLSQLLPSGQWITDQLPQLLVERAGTDRLVAGVEVSALTLAVCLTDTLRRWSAGHDDGPVESLGVPSDGWLGVPEGLVLAAPVRLVAGQYRVCGEPAAGSAGRRQVRAAADQMIAWLSACGAHMSSSGQRCTISTCASSTYRCRDDTSSDDTRATSDEDGPADRPQTAPPERDTATTGERPTSASAGADPAASDPQDGAPSAEASIAEQDQVQAEQTAS